MNTHFYKLLLEILENIKEKLPSSEDLSMNYNNKTPIYTYDAKYIMEILIMINMIKKILNKMKEIK